MVVLDWILLLVDSFLGLVDLIPPPPPSYYILQNQDLLRWVMQGMVPEDDGVAAAEEEFVAAAVVRAADNLYYLDCLPLAAVVGDVAPAVVSSYL